MPKFPKSDGFKFKNKSPFMDVATKGILSSLQGLEGIKEKTSELKQPRKPKVADQIFDPRESRGYASYLQKYKNIMTQRKAEKKKKLKDISSSANIDPVKEKQLTKEEFEIEKEKYGKSGEAGYVGRETLAKTAQMGGTLGDVWWEEEKDASVEGGGRVNPIAKKSPAKRDYMTADSPTMKKSSFFKMKGWPGFTKNK